MMFLIYLRRYQRFRVGSPTDFSPLDLFKNEQLKISYYLATKSLGDEKAGPELNNESGSVHINVRKATRGHTEHKHLLLKNRITFPLRKPWEVGRIAWGQPHTDGYMWPLAHVGAGQDGNTITAHLRGCCSAQPFPPVGGKSHPLISCGTLTSQRCHSWLGALGSGGICTWPKSRL